MQVAPLPQTFAQLYIAGSKIIGDDPTPNLPAYRDLDKLRTFVCNHPKSQDIKYSLSAQRRCISMPYASFEDKRRPPDGATVNGLPVINACVGFDQYVTLVIDQMDNSCKLPHLKEDRYLIKWKLLRLGKVFDLGWEKFVIQYLDRLRYGVEFRSSSERTLITRSMQ